MWLLPVTGIDKGHIDSCVAIRGRLRSPRLLRCLPGKAGDHKYAFCSNLGSLRTHRVLSMLQGPLWRVMRVDVGCKVCCDS